MVWTIVGANRSTQTQPSSSQAAACLLTLFGHMTPEASGEGGLFKHISPPINNNHNPCRTKAQISISKEKSECPLHAPARPLRPAIYCTRYPGYLMGRMQIREPDDAGPHLPSQFPLMMTNTFVHGEGRWE